MEKLDCIPPLRCRNIAEKIANVIVNNNYENASEVPELPNMPTNPTEYCDIYVI